jgi:hypothetical protein
LALASVRHIRDHAQPQQTFRCKAQLKAFKPDKLDDFCVPRREGRPVFEYKYALVLEDHTGWIKVYMRGKEAQRFLQLPSPVDLHMPEHQKERDCLKQNLAIMLDPHSWVDVQVKCYSVVPDKREMRPRYKIIRTAGNFALAM